ncbi:hypothetical protein NQ317_014736 [Molorchus minor]|uniref:Uncharacterized protein n=1 Tax=Molorchus minor TaxID=1323400 RepID=A0ABQ9J3G6_9CUCU|nr:hypothetical protein NQ317_014736 [Molorchus minor]
MLSKCLVFITCAMICQVETYNYVQFFNYITIKIYRYDEPVTLLQADTINDEPNVTEIIIEDESIPVLKSGTFNNLTLLKYITVLRILRIINLNFNNIKTITDNIFANLTMSRLYLKGNGIKTLEEMAFYNLSNLEILDLSSNHIEELPRDLFYQTKNLKNIDLSYNRLKSLPIDNLKRRIKFFEEPFTFSNIHEESSLDLSNNNLTYIDNYFFKGANCIKRIFLNNNNLEGISKDSFKEMVCMDTIDLEGNYLKELPNEILKVLENTNYINLINNPWYNNFVCKYDVWCQTYNKTNTVDMNCTYTY